ncbi:hypothetical protein [Mycoplasma suis]|uniref:Uncharacterized protein n=1 Tax=Mycoplasma suis (strain Illinois) TaxID=768700 RepID=F0QQ71_MYCSL|nr:hypothetical protein [Mycoplasma suis]ADX97641.1 hypothetical protein MSU_0097 [Mycoplasma suis str. Illinois]
MFGTATWVKIALAIVSFGSAAGGTYLIKNRVNEEEITKKQNPDTLKKEALDSGDGSEEKRTITQDVSANTEDTEKREQDSHTSSPEQDDNVSSTSSSEPKNEELGDNSESTSRSDTNQVDSSLQGQSDGKGGAENSQDVLSTTSTNADQLSEKDSLKEQDTENREVESSSSSTQSLVQSSPDSSGEGMQSERLSITSENYRSGSEFRKTTFGEGGRANTDISGEYILLSGDDSGSSGRKDICSLIKEGVGEEQSEEECKQWVSQKLGNEEQKKNLRIWFKTKDKKHSKEILEGLFVNNSSGKWFEDNSEIEVTFGVGDTLTCKQSEVTSDSSNQEFTVSCYQKVTTELTT